MPNRQRPRTAAAHLRPPILPPPAEVWQMRQAGTPAQEIAARYGVGVRSVHNALRKWQIRNFPAGPRKYPLILGSAK